MTMNDATKMAVTLARKGASDEVITLVMEALTPCAPDRAVVEEFRTDRNEAHTAPRVRMDRRIHLYVPLLAAIRHDVAASGAISASALWLCQRYPAEWEKSRAGTMPLSARGLAGIIAHAIRSDKGAVEGLRFQFERVDRKPTGTKGGGGVAIYRVELA